MKQRSCDFEELRKIARDLRVDIIKMIYHAGSGHPGGSLSLVEIMVYLYWCWLRHRPEDPNWEDRDRLILSKGHAAPVLYSVLARQGYFPYDDLWSLRKVYSHLQGHPSRLDTPGVEASTGSLGQGFSVALGMALGLRLDKKDSRVYVILGDGEINEGQVWEAAMAASHYKVDNLTAFLDFNRLQIDGEISEVMDSRPVDRKFQAFGWETLTIDGHNFEEIEKALKWAKEVKGKPQMIIAHTVKGKGVSFMENRVEWHGKAPNKEQYLQALKELGVEIPDESN